MSFYQTKTQLQQEASRVAIAMSDHPEFLINVQSLMELLIALMNQMRLPEVHTLIS